MKVSVIGGGLGGLLAGAALSKDHDVHIYEQLEIYGGRFTNLPYKGFQLSTGAFHMIPHGPTGPLASLLRDVGANVDIVKTNPEATFMTKDLKQIPFRDFNELLSAASRSRIPALVMRTVTHKKGNVADMVWNDPEWLAIADSCCGWALSTTAQNTPASEAVAILTTTRKYGTPGVPMGGCKGVVDALADVIESNGGSVSLNSKVDSIMVEDGKAAGVVVGGERISSDIVISNIGHKLTSRLYDGKYLEPKYAGVINKVRPSAGIKIVLAAEEPLVGHPAAMFTPYTQRVNGINEVSHIDPSLAPEGMHLTMSHQTMRTPDVQKEIELGLQDLKNLFPGKKYSVLMVQSYRDDWPVNRISSGFDLGNLTPVRGLFVVGDGAKGKGGIEVEGIALGVRNFLDIFDKAY
ncbi:NAD(P)/FAD-dependent oxidoreductase [Methanocella sp. CWC-04]|uniref:NAD(P)/FAD-dependent oxidoreductase n=1 Tax=Methanooceanicella nereidis TaxID=2052831 RepID=A0AAP2RE92_9EURY|nr:NAD(P)/FAD-dependent oxidoreductase [Methanocella sp. CWC-04]MCD1294935.1 NAD(P)/FAD-dependent oxidoreductase [Methanocella sp. CWC-04]